MKNNPLLYSLKKILRPAYHWLVPRILPQPQKLVILCNGRTGSNYLESMLDSHPGIRMFEAVIGEASLEKNKAEILRSGAINYFKKQFKRQWKEDLTACKILYYQMEPAYFEAWGIPDLPRTLQYLQENRRFKIIHLKRRNKLHTVVSTRVAAATKVYVIKNDSQRITSKHIEITPQELEQDFRHIALWENKIDAAYQHHQLLEVVYEDLVSQPQAECNRILDFLKLERVELKAQTLKQIVQPLSEIVSNYDELKAHFASSEWAELFLEGEQL